MSWLLLARVCRGVLSPRQDSHESCRTVKGHGGSKFLLVNHCSESARFLCFRWPTIQARIARGQMRKIGYARVSSAAQNLDRQLGALRAE